MILAIDPGTTKSGLVIWDGKTVLRAESDVPNEDVIGIIQGYTAELPFGRCPVTCEWIESYGMAVGAEVFVTCRWVGRFEQAVRGRPDDGGHFHLVTRREVKLHLCHTGRATDANIRQAILDRFGGKDAAVGKKKTPGPLYSVKDHAWSALAVAITWADTHP